MIRVTIVSPNSALRIGLRELLGRQPDIKVVGETVDLESVNENETEVVLLASVSSARLLESKYTFAVLFLTDDVESLRGLLNSNPRAWGVLSPDATEDELVAASPRGGGRALGRRTKPGRGFDPLVWEEGIFQRGFSG